MIYLIRNEVPGGAPPTTSELDDAVRELVATGAVTVEQVPSMGCNIKWAG